MKHAKHIANNDRELESLKRELELDAVPAAVDAKLRQVYAELPDELPRRRSAPGWAKGLGMTAASLAAAFLLLFGVNTAFPAFAEGLPFVGRYFQAANRHDGFNDTLSMGKVTVGANLGGYDTQPVMVSQNRGGCDLMAEQAYCDGEYLTVSLSLSVPLDQQYKSEYILPESFSASVDGVPTESVSTKTGNGTGLYFVPDGEGGYTGAVTLALPESAKGKDTLTVELEIDKLGGKRYEKDDYADDTLRLDGKFRLGFTVPVSMAHNLDFDVSAEDNGMRISHVAATPISTKITVTEPFWGVNKGADIVLLTPEAEQIAFNGQLSYTEGYAWGIGIDYNEESGQWEGESFTGTACFDGVPAGTDQVILRVYEDYEEEAVLAEFTIDLAARTAAPSQTWAGEGDLGIDSPFHYKYLNGFRPAEDYYKEDGLFIYNVMYDKPENYYSVEVWSEEDFRPLKAELLNSQGEVVAQELSVDQVSHAMYRTGFDRDSQIPAEDAPKQPWSEEPIELENVPMHSINLYTFAMLETSYQPAYGEVMTVRLSDAKTGELLTSQELVMDVTSH